MKMHEKRKASGLRAEREKLSSIQPPTSGGSQSRVIDISSWRTQPKPARTSDAPMVTLSRERVRSLSFQEKQAVLLRFILADKVVEQDLDALIETAMSVTRESVRML